MELIMEKDIKISIIMPVFNAVKYIDTVIKSILSQTYQKFELIIVDDGATDGTSEICQKYAAENQCIKYVKQQNKGTCAARNRGISIAVGEYITFSDHDDEYLPDYLKIMIEKAEKENLDVVKCGVYFEETYANGNNVTRIETFKEGTLSRKELIKKYNSLPVCYFGVWNSLYRTKMIRKNRICFSENMRHGQEDFCFNTELIPHISNIGFTSYCLYKHYRRLSQSTSAQFYEDRIDSMSYYFKKECDLLIPLFEKEERYKEYIFLYARKLTGILSYCLRNLTYNQENICRDSLSKFVAENSFSYHVSFLRVLFPLWKTPKYAITLYLVLNRYYKGLFLLWQIKNK